MRTEYRAKWLTVLCACNAFRRRHPLGKNVHVISSPGIGGALTHKEVGEGNDHVCSLFVQAVITEINMTSPRTEAGGSGGVMHLLLL
jgi:hypothetical protein